MASSTCLVSAVTREQARKEVGRGRNACQGERQEVHKDQTVVRKSDSVTFSRPLFPSRRSPPALQKRSRFSKRSSGNCLPKLNVWYALLDQMDLLDRSILNPQIQSNILYKYVLTLYIPPAHQALSRAFCPRRCYRRTGVCPRGKYVLFQYSLSVS